MFIVQGQDTATVAAAVQAVGGEITHELGIIHAVGAVLTPAQQLQLEHHEAVQRIYADRTLSLSTGNTVRDEFNSTSYGNNNGFC